MFIWEDCVESNSSTYSTRQSALYVIDVLYYDYAGRMFYPQIAQDSQAAQHVIDVPYYDYKQNGCFTHLSKCFFSCIGFH